jgi:hypothetical protein
MQNTLLSLVLLLFCSFYSQAQRGSQIGLYLLPENTHIATNIHNDPIYRNKLTFAGGGGITYTYGMTERLSVQLGLLYTAHNQKWAARIRVTPDSTRPWKGKKRLDYLNLPILLKYNTKMGKRMRSNFFGGVQLSYLLKGSGGLVIFRHDDSSDYFDLPVSHSNYYKPWIVQAVAGYGLDFHLARNWSLNTALRLEVSVVDGTNKSKIYQTEPYDDLNPAIEKMQSSRNWALGLLVGVSYHFTSNHLLCPSQKW